MKYTYLLIFTLTSLACHKYLKIDPPTDHQTAESIFQNDSLANAAIMGIYAEMTKSAQSFASGNTTFYTGLAADEFEHTGGPFEEEFRLNDLRSTNSIIAATFWESLYKIVYSTNLMIEKLPLSPINIQLKTQLLGELHFIRAFCYLHLTNFFGDVPLVLTSDYRVANTLPRTQAAKVQDHLITELNLAITYLSTSGSPLNGNRPNVWAANALLARISLYNEKWKVAVAIADEIITSGYYKLAPLHGLFLNNSSETIWQLPTARSGINTYEGFTFLPASNTSLPLFYVSEKMISYFEVSDSRKQVWLMPITYLGRQYFCLSKYRIRQNAIQSEHCVILRLAEIHLIRAEARAHQSDISGALDDINIIRSRANLSPVQANNIEEILELITHEKKIEFLGEWGHRWFDLKRLGIADSVMKIVKPGSWQKADQLWPIPQRELTSNPFLTQNPGY